MANNWWHSSGCNFAKGKWQWMIKMSTTRPTFCDRYNDTDFHWGPFYHLLVAGVKPRILVQRHGDGTVYSYTHRHRDGSIPPEGHLVPPSPPPSHHLVPISGWNIYFGPTISWTKYTYYVVFAKIIEHTCHCMVEWNLEQSFASILAKIIKHILQNMQC